ncbi:hypothetical protein I3760_14G132900 [Carya illinoinensis]|nr:hypothetical protein I3760_14G132900 [Carya illinoinensis]
MRQIAMDRKSNELPHPAAATIQTDNPTSISLKGLWLLAKDTNIEGATRKMAKEQQDTFLCKFVQILGMRNSRIATSRFRNHKPLFSKPL